MSVERELGQLTEAVKGLKDSHECLGKKVDSLNSKFDRHLENYASLQYRVGKMAGTVALVVSLLLAGAKEALARAFNVR